MLNVLKWVYAFHVVVFFVVVRIAALKEQNNQCHMLKITAAAAAKPTHMRVARLRTKNLRQICINTRNHNSTIQVICSSSAGRPVTGMRKCDRVPHIPYGTHKCVRVVVVEHARTPPLHDCANTHTRTHMGK